jgi:hypothetical protein
MVNKTHAALCAVAGLAFVALTGCNVKDQLLQPQNPGLIDPSAVGSPTAALALRVGALSRYKQLTNGNGTEAVWEYGGTLADEYKNADFLTDRVAIDQRIIDPANGIISGQTATYSVITQSRGFVRDAITAMKTYLPDSTGLRGELWAELGFLEMTLADNFCNGIPLGHTIAGVQTFGDPLTTSQVYDSASAHLDSALALTTATDAGTVGIHNFAAIIKARILVAKGNFGAVAAVTTNVPTAFQYAVTFSSTGGGTNGVWSLVNSIARVTVSDSVDIVNGVPTTIKNALPFVSANDPRVPTISGKLSSPIVGAEDQATPVFLNLLVKNQFDPIVLGSGVDARLFEAEAKLNANDIPGMMTILNALRTAPQTLGIFKVAAMAALPTPADKTTATDLFFREKALWQFERGYRMDDLRRLVRQYGRTQDKVFPSGNFTRNGTPSGTYGSQVAFPVPDQELNNPNFHGCLDTKA